MNSIVIYVCQEVMRLYFPVQFDIKDTHAVLLAVDVWGTGFWLLVAAFLHYKNISLNI